MVEELLVNRTASLARESTKRTPVRIKIVGVGGGGCNCVRRMMRYNRLPGVSFAMVNTEIEAPEARDGDVDRIQIGAGPTRGWSAGADFEVDAAATHPPNGLRRALGSAELVFVTAGMGGATGTGAAPYVASLAREMGAMVVGMVTTPFTFEGGRRRDQALRGVDGLRPYVDSLIVIHNDRLLDFIEDDASMADAFRAADEAVARGIMSVSEMINVPGETSVDFADAKRVLVSTGGALMAIGSGCGDTGAVEAARMAVASPLLDRPIKDARGVLFSLKGGKSLTPGAANAARELISSSVNKDADISFGMSVDESLGEEVNLTLIATGLDQGHSHRKRSSLSEQQPKENGGRRKLRPGI